ncbi:hypothetical protein HHK36_028008 [Tetracentron sinense]|uniref:Formyl transferase N-terminal domain-containing protein n=1 Tax=Tetracentron sinense TaxID=13715 RepID=A0A834YJ45_TETSI|nr:hypothetical protein HHK36_028008 [Tetracentron sinense]
MTLLRRVSFNFPQVLGFTRRSFNSWKSPGESLESSSASTLTHGIHVFQCPLSDCIASKGGNILSVDVFVPENKQVFYSRSEFVFDSVRWPRAEMDEDFRKLSKLFNAMKSIVRVPNLDPKYKISVLASKQDHCLVDLLHGWQDGRLPVDITCVISNHNRDPNTHVIRFLERHGIPYHHLRTAAGNKREAEILDLVQNTDFLVLARYMQILSGNFLESYGKDVINIHHGLLPSFKGGNPSRQAFDAGVKLIGATSHFVTEELDAGPIIEQMPQAGFKTYLLVESLEENVPEFSMPMMETRKHEHFYFISYKVEARVERVSHRDNLRSFVQKSENLEKQCLAKAVRSYCELRVLPYEEIKTVVF